MDSNAVENISMKQYFNTSLGESNYWLFTEYLQTDALRSTGCGQWRSGWLKYLRMPLKPISSNRLTYFPTKMPGQKDYTCRNSL